MKTLTIGDNHVMVTPNGDVEFISAKRKTVMLKWRHSTSPAENASAPEDDHKITIPKEKRVSVAALLLGYDEYETNLLEVQASRKRS